MKGVADLVVALGITLEVHVVTEEWIRESGAREKFEVPDLPEDEAVEMIGDLILRQGLLLFFV